VVVFFGYFFGFGTVRDANYFVKQKIYTQTMEQSAKFSFWEQKAEMEIELERISIHVWQVMWFSRNRKLYTLRDGS
jgi:hypothetical protein